MAVVLGTSIGWANAWALGLEPRLDLAGGIQREEGKGRLSIKYSEYQTGYLPPPDISLCSTVPLLEPYPSSAISL
jgi:hypothetical protein